MCLLWNVLVIIYIPLWGSPQTETLFTGIYTKITSRNLCLSNFWITYATGMVNLPPMSSRDRTDEESTFMGGDSKLSISLVIRPVLLPKLYLSYTTAPYCISNRYFTPAFKNLSQLHATSCCFLS